MRRLVRADCWNEHFGALESEWEQQVTTFDDSIDYESARMQHARSIAAEDPPSKVYGIFVLHDDAAQPGRRYSGLVHVNHAFPKTSKPILRMVWVLLAPIYDYQDVEPNEIADITGTILHDGIKLCQSDMWSVEMKLHLGSSLDRRYALGVARGLQLYKPEIQAAVRGNWLHLNGI